MSTSPVITIFVRHAADCKYLGDEFCKRCSCRKHLRWTQKGKQHRRKAGTRSWEEAERKKRELEDQLSGKTPEAKPEQEQRDLQTCIDIFVQDKKNQGITEKVIGKYTRELARLRVYCERQNAFTVQRITRELLTGFCTNWPELYSSSYTRAKVLNPDLVLLDLSMPIMNGLDAARELSRIRPDLPVVMFTDSPEIAREALLCGCKGVVSKTKVLLLISVIHDIFAKAA